MATTLSSGFAFVVLQGDGSDTYSFPFNYLKQEHIKCKLNGVDTAYEWINSNTIQLPSAASGSDRVEIYRETDRDGRLVDFQDQSTLTEKTLDLDSDQIFNISQEAIDEVSKAVSIDTALGVVDMGGARLVNVGAPVNPTDAAINDTKDTVLNYKNEAEAARDAAQAAQTAAESAETNATNGANTATTQAANAANSAAAASTSETNAASSETNAANSASSASSSEGNASTSETNAAASAAAAALSETNAAASAAAAALSETNASTSETNAEQSATDAAQSASDAQTAKNEAQTIVDNFAGFGSVSVNQAAHGFTVGMPIYGNNTNGYNKADPTDPNKLPLFLVTSVTDADNFKYQREGNAEITGHGFTVGEYYFADIEGVAGSVTVTDPYTITNNFEKFRCPVFYVLDADNIVVMTGAAQEALTPKPPIDADPVGKVSLWFTDTAPDDHLILMGQDLSRTLYPELFAVWGTMYGVGDGSTTFGTPNVDDKFLRILGAGGGVDANSRTDRGDGTTGDSVGTLQGDAIRNITGTHQGWTGVTVQTSDVTVGAIRQYRGFGNGYTWTSNSQYTGSKFDFDASRVVPTGSDNRPSNIYAYAIVKYRKSIVSSENYAVAISESTGVSDANKPVKTDVSGKLHETLIHQVIDEENTTITGGSGSEISNVSNVKTFGSRIGKVMTLGFTCTFDMATGNNYDSYNIPLSNFAFLDGETVSAIGGSFATNVNSSSSYGAAISGYFQLNEGNLLLSFSGDFYSQANRNLSGSLVILLE